MPTELTVRHLPDRGRFEAVVDGATSELEYRIADGVMTILHTGVPPQLEGRGIAGALMKATLAYVQSAGLKVRPRCSYASAYFQRHPELASLLDS